MAKKKRKKKAATRKKADILDFMNIAKQKVGLGNGYLISEHGKNYRGIPMPSLALEYLFGCDKMVLGMMYGISGPPGSFKSTTAMEIGCWIAKCGGINFLSETEGGKISPSMVASMWGNAELAQRCLVETHSSLEDSQSFLTRALQWVKSSFPNRDAMAVLMLDSLNGAAAKERGKAIEKDGHASRDFPTEALLWSKWFQEQASNFLGWPLMFLFVNHEKRDIGSKNAHAKRTPGGDAQWFHSTVYISSHAIKKTVGATMDVHQIRLKTMKNSFGELGREMHMPVMIDKTGRTNTIRVDWGHATAHLLNLYRERLKDILLVTTTTESMTALTRRFSCKQLKLVNVTGAELGAAVQAGGNMLLEELRQALRIEAFEEWDGIERVEESEIVLDGEEEAAAAAEVSDEGLAL